MKTTKCSDVKITPVVVQPLSSKNVRGWNWFHHYTHVIGLFARTKSGKSTVIYRMLEDTVPKGHRVTIFCPSIDHDKTYVKMRKMLKKKKCKVQCYQHFLRDDGTSIIDDIMQEYVDEVSVKPDKSPESETPSLSQLMFENQTIRLPPVQFSSEPVNPFEPRELKKKDKQKQKNEKPRKPKKFYPEHTIIIDDLSSSCKVASLTQILCRCRHQKLRIFLSLHSINDIQPAAINQLTNVLLFGNISKDKIIELAEKMGVTFKNDTKREPFLWKLYQDATALPYNFLNIDRQEMTFRKNFNEMYSI